MSTPSYDNQRHRHVRSEPSTFALLGVGAIGLAAWTWRMKCHRGLLAVAMLAAGAILPQAGVAATVGLNFTGSNINQSGFIPPDTDGAVGPGYFVELLNGRYAVYDRTTGVLDQSSSLSGFWNATGGGLCGQLSL